MGLHRVSLETVKNSKFMQNLTERIFNNFLLQKVYLCATSMLDHSQSLHRRHTHTHLRNLEPFAISQPGNLGSIVGIGF
jgi:hypothetical protein